MDRIPFSQPFRQPVSQPFKERGRQTVRWIFKWFPWAGSRLGETQCRSGWSIDKVSVHWFRQQEIIDSVVHALRSRTWSTCGTCQHQAVSCLQPCQCTYVRWQIDSDVRWWPVRGDVARRRLWMVDWLTDWRNGVHSMVNDWIAEWLIDNLIEWMNDWVKYLFNARCNEWSDD